MKTVMTTRTVWLSLLPAALLLGVAVSLGACSDGSSTTMERTTTQTTTPAMPATTTTTTKTRTTP